MEFLDNLLNRITMYRLLLYYLEALVAAGVIFAALGWLPFSPVALIVSSLTLLITAWIVNKIFGFAYGAPTNSESSYITALILALIMSPATLQPFNAGAFWGIVWAAVIAMASKYILAIRKKHIFNPAAIAVVVTAFAFGQYASWWVGGNLPMLPLLLIGGFLLGRKVPRFDFVIAFFVASLASAVLTNPGFDPLQTVERALLHSSIFFFAFIMLTEPATTPPVRPTRVIYGALIGALFAPNIHIGSIYSTPELALVTGNLFSYFVSPKTKYLLNLKSTTDAAANVHDFAFASPTAFKFRPGQYMEFTLPDVGTDGRGNRRYFTIASSPTEPDLHLGVKYYDHPSSFKRNLLALKPDTPVLAGNLAGDFTLPRDASKKLLFIAGGIGVTPFRSMVKYLSDRGERRDIVLLYSNKNETEIAYREVFNTAAQTIGLKIVYVNTDTDGRIDAAFIRRAVPDFRERTAYFSGPHMMVEAFKKTFRELGVPRIQIKTDFFPGLV